MLPPSHSAPVEGGRGRTFFQGAEEGAAAAAGGGSWIQMENEGEAGASSPKAEGEDWEHVIPGGWWLFPSCSQAPSTPRKHSTWP